MAIAVYKYTSNFTIIGNACFNDQRLSFEALAIFTYLRSKPSDWKVMQTELARRFRAGRDRVRNAINELIAAGYIRKVQERIAGRWSVVGYDVLAMPDAPVPEAPSPENRSLLSIDLLPSTDSTNNNTIPSLRSGDPSAEEADASRALKADDDDRDGSKVDAKPTPAKPLPRDHQPKAPYLQSAEAAKHALFELQEMPFGTEWCGGLDDWGADFNGMSDRSERGVNFHWKRLLRKGCHADDVVRFAERFLSQTPRHRRPSLAGFLARFEDYLGNEAGDAASPPRATATNRRHQEHGIAA